MAASKPFLPSGTVYGTLLNFEREWRAWADQMDAAPYKGAPKAPVLYIKPANTWSANGADIPVPAHVPQVEIGATLAMVLEENSAIALVNAHLLATNVVANWVLMNDLSIPHASFFRPPVKFKCLDGFLGVGAPRAATSVDESSGFSLQVRVNGMLVQSVDFAHLRRQAAQLLADVREFMDLQTGDVLMLGCDVCDNGKRPLASVGDVIEITAPGFAPLVNRLVAAP
jgi:5-oxopent-3-ene-1,2,5-tricarboxylate decarboxylase / 2-hydroxyhepta-2,4-diene-1,7-dioate isomerase